MKFAIGLVILVLVMMNVRKERIPQGLWAGILLLAGRQRRRRRLLVARAPVTPGHAVWCTSCSA